MSQFQQDIINSFHSLVKEHEIDCKHKKFTHARSEYDVYSVPYSPIINLFVSHLTGLDKSLISQYITAQKFLFLLSDSAVIDVKVCLCISEDHLSINFKKSIDVNFELENPEFMTVIISSDNALRFSTYHGNLLNNFENAYNGLLAYIKLIIDPELSSFSYILDLSNQNTVDVINKRLINSEFKTLNFNDFKELYSIHDSDIFVDGSSTTARMTDKNFELFLKDYFSNDFCTKFKNILSLGKFLETFFKRNVNWAPSVKSNVSIQFEHVSKYAECNNVYNIFFGIDHRYDCRFTISLYDDGAIDFYNGGENLTDLNTVYDFLRECLIKKLENCLSVDRSDITLKHLNICEMILT